MPISFDNALATTFGASGTNTNAATVDITTATVGSIVYTFFNDHLATCTVSAFTGWTQLGINKTLSLVGAYDVWYRKKVAGDTTFSVTLGSSSYGVIQWASYLGVQQNSSGTDSPASATFTNTSYTTPTGTPTAPKRWAVGFFAGEAGSAVTAVSFPTPTGMQIRNQQFIGTAVTGTNRPASMISDTNGYVSISSQSYTAVPTVTGGTAASGCTALIFLVEAPIVPVPFVTIDLNQSTNRAANY